MKHRMTTLIRVLFLGLAGLPLLMAGGALAMEAAPQMIRANALLAVVYKKDPAAGIRFATEVHTYLASARQGEISGTRRSGPRFKRRGGAALQPGDPESEMERQNKQVFDKNPALRKMYFHSPVAYLRMLSRLRQAAAAGAKAAPPCNKAGRRSNPRCRR